VEKQGIIERIEEVLKLVVLSCLLLLPSYLLYTPIHEGFHALGCIGTGLEIQSIDWLGSVDCKGLGDSAWNSLIVYSSPYIFGLFALLGLHSKEKKLEGTKLYPYLSGIISVIYFDVLMNGFVMMGIGYVTGYYSLVKTDLVKMASVDLYISYIFYALFVAILILWWFRGRETMLKFYTVVENVIERIENSIRKKAGSYFR
jgi:hypothetical protein